MRLDHKNIKIDEFLKRSHMVLKEDIKFIERNKIYGLIKMPKRYQIHQNLKNMIKIIFYAVL